MFSKKIFKTTKIKCLRNPTCISLLQSNGAVDVMLISDVIITWRWRHFDLIMVSILHYESKGKIYWAFAVIMVSWYWSDVGFNLVLTRNPGPSEIGQCSNQNTVLRFIIISIFKFLHGVYTRVDRIVIGVKFRNRRKRYVLLTPICWFENVVVIFVVNS